jgi:YidC/Oxa1 family membrane protein insertase
MSEIKNLFIATVLSILVLIGWQSFYESKNPPKQEIVKESSDVNKNESIEQSNPEKDVEKIQISSNNKNTDERTVQKTIRTENKINIKNYLIPIDNSHIDGNFSKQGLIFNKISLKNYHETIDNNSPEVKLLDKKDGYYGEIGFLPDENNSVHLPNKATIWDADGDKITSEKPLTLTWINDQNIKFVIRISLDEDYLFKIEKQVLNNQNDEIEISTFTRLYKALDNSSRGGIGHEGIIGFFNKELLKTTYDKLIKQENIAIKSRDKNDKLSWIGFGDKYWMSAIIGNETNSSAIMKGDIKDGDKFVQIENKYSQNLQPQDEFRRTEYLFVGAKELETLDKYEKDYKITMLDHAVDFGTLYFITKPIFLFLQYLHKIIGNFGIAIMILTLVIKILLFPLTKKSLISMHRMRQLQPQLDDIKKRLKDDKTRMNLEIVSLFKTNKISPFSSIIPMLIQIPIFFALYKVLYITIEMRHAPFFGWIHDLSARDTLNIFSIFDKIHLNVSQYLNLGVLSLILGATMLLQQKTQPKPTDASQATVMKWMPIIFTIASSSFPAGLVIYWSWNNILSMIQQLIVDKIIIKKPKHNNNVEKIK